MTVVDRFIEFQRWPTSRKTVWLMGIAFAAHVPLSIVALWGVASSGVTDSDSFGALLLAAVAICIATTLAGWVCDRRGIEGRWTAYAVVLVYGGWLLAFATAMGIWSTPLMAWIPTVVILVSIWYDERVGWWAFAYAIAALSIVSVLTLWGAMPYAPFITSRSVDAQKDAGWFLAMLTPYFGSFLYGFLLCVLVVAARRVQEQRLERAHRLIRRYVPAQVADAVITQGESVDRHERRKLTLFFSDLVGFTEIAEEMEPEDLSRVLNDYFADMNAIADRHGGTVDELMGDAILIFFGAPVATDDRDHALRAVRMAVEMQAAVVALNANWKAAGIDVALQVRMGINTGVVTIGNFGSPDRMKYAVLGKHVNLAARLQTACVPGQILLSHATWLLVGEQVPCTPKGEMQLKGVSKPIATYGIAMGEGAQCGR